MSIPEELLGEFDFDDIFHKPWDLKPGKEFVVRGVRRGRPMDVKEKSFSSTRYAKKFIEQLFTDNYEVTVATNTAIFILRGINTYEFLDQKEW